MYKRILTIQDISCVGQCSMTVALPILSACGIETCILPTAVLSTHTSGFSNFTVKDLSDEFSKIIKHWKSECFAFDAVYTGYLGNPKHVEYVEDICGHLLTETGKLIVDPAMADNGKLYYGFDKTYVESMKDLCKNADILLPNLTEACLLADVPYPEKVTEGFVKNLLLALSKCYKAEIVLTGIGFNSNQTGIMVASNGTVRYYSHKKIPKSFHGTGDIFSSVFVGAFLQDKPLMQAVRIAADFTVNAIEGTLSDSSHWYGVKFEPELKHLSEELF